MNTLSVDIRTSLRAAVAVALSTGIAHLFHLRRSYWVIIVAVVVLAETWGASIQRAIQRVTGTAAGCVIGWELQRLAGRSEWVNVGLMLTCVFLAIYFRGYSYPLMMFFITIYVVFLFSLLGEWNSETALLRLIDTAIGGAVAILATLIVRPARAAQLRDDLRSLWKCCEAQLGASLAAIAPLEQKQDVEACRDSLYRAFETLRAHIAISPYENILRPVSVGRIRTLVEQTEAIVRHVLALAEVVRSGSLHRLQPLESELSAVASEAMDSVRRLLSDSTEEAGRTLKTACEQLESSAIDQEREGNLGAAELLLICSVAFHLVRIGRAVDRIIELKGQLRGHPEVPSAVATTATG